LAISGIAINNQIIPFDKADIAQLIDERPVVRVSFELLDRTVGSYYRDGLFYWLLCAGQRNAPRRSATENANELPSPHSIIPPASAGCGSERAIQLDKTTEDKAFQCLGWVIELNRSRGKAPRLRAEPTHNAPGVLF
jgi:hypothetical protein